MCQKRKWPARADLLPAWRYCTWRFQNSVANSLLDQAPKLWALAPSSGSAPWRNCMMLSRPQWGGNTPTADVRLAPDNGSLLRKSGHPAAAHIVLPSRAREAEVAPSPIGCVTISGHNVLRPSRTLPRFNIAATAQ